MPESASEETNRMAKLGNLLFARTLNQFLECEDTGSRKALGLIQKIRESAGQNVEKLMTTITQADGQLDPGALQVHVQRDQR